MIDVKYDKNLDIYHEHFVGSFTIDDMVSYYDSAGKNKQLLRKRYVIVDYTQAEFIFSIEDLNKLADIVKKNIGNYKYVKAAVLHSKPYEQAISMIFEDLIKNIPNFYTQIFSTKEAATKWLLFYDVDHVRKKELIKKEGEG